MIIHFRTEPWKGRSFPVLFFGYVEISEKQIDKIQCAESFLCSVAFVGSIRAFQKPNCSADFAHSFRADFLTAAFPV